MSSSHLGLRLCSNNSLRVSAGQQHAPVTTVVQLTVAKHSVLGEDSARGSTGQCHVTCHVSRKVGMLLVTADVNRLTWRLKPLVPL